MAVSKIGLRFLHFFSLQPGQGTRTILTALYLFLVIASYLMLKTASSSLFLKKLGAEKLPYITIIVAVGLGFFVALYIRLSRRVLPGVLVVATLGFCVANLLVFWWLLQVQWTWAYPVFSIWVGMYGAIAPTQVWTLANELFTTREAKRVFGILGAGGIFGGIAGSYLTRFLVALVGTANLVLVAAGMLVLAGCIVVALGRYRLPTKARSDDLPPPRQLLDSLKLIARSPHLKLVASLVFFTALATKMVDWQFSAVAAATFETEDSLSAFFGTFYGTAGILGFLVQVLLTSRLLQLLGLGGTILFFPLALTGGTLALIPTLSLWSAILTRGADTSLKHSIDRSSRELVYLPVNRSIKVQAKSAIDMVVDRAGDGVAGFVQLALITGLSAAGMATLGIVRWTAVANLAFLAAWLFIAIRLRRSYVEELSSSIAKGRIDVGSWHEAQTSAEMHSAVVEALQSGHEPTALAALELAAQNPQWDVRSTLEELAKTGGPEVRARALAILLDPEDPNLPAGVTEQFEREDQDLLAECIDLQLSADPEDRLERAQKILARAGGAARGAWIALMVRRLGPEFYPMARGLMQELLRPESPPAAREVASTAIGLIPADSGFATLLPELLADEDPRVAAAAARSAAAVGGADMLRRVVPLLGAISTRKAARLALQSRTDEAIEVLAGFAGDGGSDAAVRLRVPAVLAGIRSRNAIHVLVDMMTGDDRPLAHAASEALYRIRLQKQDWALIPEKEARLLVEEQARHCRFYAEQQDSIEHWLREEKEHAGGALLVASLQQVQQWHQSAIFRMLCLCYSPRNILNSRRSLLDDNLEVRANAAELLDNMVPRRLWRDLLPILYREEFGKGGDADLRRLIPRDDALEALAGCSNTWLQACALQLIGDLRLSEKRATVKRLRDDNDARVREAAAYALAAIEGRSREMSDMTVVQKVVALQRVEVFRGTPAEQLSLIAAVGREVTFPADERLWEQGDAPGDLFIILDGKVAIERDGNRLGELGVGDALGTWELLEDEPRQVSVTTLEETSTLRIDRWGFQEVLAENPEISRNLIQQLIRRLRRLAS